MKRLLFFLLCSTALFAQAGGQPISVPIQNPSFEQAPALAFNQDSCGPWVYDIPGWMINVLLPGDGGGTFRPSEPSPCMVSAPPDGQQVAYLFHSSISQNLGTGYPVGVYTLKFSVADRFYWYATRYSASLAYGPFEQCSTSGYAMGDFQEITLTCPIQRNPTPQQLNLTITGDGDFMLLVDNVSLTFTPES